MITLLSILYSVFQGHISVVVEHFPSGFRYYRRKFPPKVLQKKDKICYHCFCPGFHCDSFFPSLCRGRDSVSMVIFFTKTKNFMYRRALGEHSWDSSLSVRDRIPCILRNIQFIKKESRSNANE